jgi:hypothetical protein
MPHLPKAYRFLSPNVVAWKAILVCRKPLFSFCFIHHEKYWTFVMNAQCSKEVFDDWQM